MTDVAASPIADPWRLLTVALIIQLGFSSLDQGVPLLTGFVKVDLGVSATIAGLAVSSYLFGKVLGAYAGGVAADRLGERKVLVTAGVVAAVVVGVAVTQQPLVLFPLLFLAGTASAAATPAGGRMILLAFRPERRGLALGIRQAGIPIAGLVVAIVLPAIARADGWRVALAVAAGMMALSVIPLVFTHAPRGTRAPHASGQLRAVSRDLELRRLTVWGCLLVTGQYAIVAFLALDMHESRGISLPLASLAVAVAQGAGIVGRIGWGAVSDRLIRLGRRPLLVVCTFVGLASSLILLCTPSSAPVWIVVAAAALAGLSLIGYQGLWVTMISEAAGPDVVGAATGFAVTFVVATAAVSPPLFGLAADVFSTYRAVWAVLSLALAAALIPALAPRRA